MSITLQLKATLVSVFLARSTKSPGPSGWLGAVQYRDILLDGIHHSGQIFSVFGFSFVSRFLNASMGSSSMLADDLNIIYSG
jgi:hypothetical protein